MQKCPHLSNKLYGHLPWSQGWVTSKKGASVPGFEVRNHKIPAALPLEQHQVRIPRKAGKVTASHSLCSQNPSDSLYRSSQREWRGLKPLSLGLWGHWSLKGAKGRQGKPPLRDLSDGIQVKLGPSPSPMTGPLSLHKPWATERPGGPLADARSECDQC